jgi:hypothetical protein
MKPWGEGTDFINVDNFEVKKFLEEHSAQLWADTKAIALSDNNIKNILV